MNSEDKLTAAESRMDKMLADAEPAFQRMERLADKLNSRYDSAEQSSDDFNTKPSRGAYVTRELQPEQLEFYKSRETRRQAYKYEREHLYKLNGSWDGQLTPADEIDIDQKVDSEIPVTSQQRETEARLRGDPYWKRYDSKTKLKHGNLYSQVMTLGTVDFINRQIDKLPQNARHTIAGNLLGVQDSFTSGIGYMADTALALSSYASGMYVYDNFAGAGDKSIFYSARKTLQKTMDSVKYHYFQDLTNINADPNREYKKIMEDGYLRYEWDDKEFGPDPWYSPVSISQFSGNLVGQFLALGLAGKAAGTLRGVSKLKPAEQTKFLRNSTAAAMTAVGMGQVNQHTRESLKQQGWSEEDAAARGDFVAALYSPVAYALNKIDPQTQLLSKGSLAIGSRKVINNFVPMIIRGAAIDVFQNGADESWRQVEYNTLVGDWNKQSIKESLREVGIAAGTGALSGMFFGGLSAIRKTYDRSKHVDVLDEIEKRGVDPDATDMRSMYNSLVNDFGLDKRKAVIGATLMDNLIRHKAKKDGVDPKEAWAAVMANKSEYDITPQTVLFQDSKEFFAHHYKAEDVVLSQEFMSQFKKPRPISEVYGYLENKLGRRALWTSGLDEWYRLETSDISDSGDMTGKSPDDIKQITVNATQVRDALKNSLMKLESIRTRTPEQVQRLSELNNSYSELAVERFRLREQGDKAKTDDERVEVGAKLDELQKESDAIISEVRSLRSLFTPTYENYASIKRPGVLEYFEYVARFPEDSFFHGIALKDVQRGSTHKFGGAGEKTINPYFWIRGTMELVDGKKTMVVQELQGDIEQSRIGVDDATQKVLQDLKGHYESEDSKEPITDAKPVIDYLLKQKTVADHFAKVPEDMRNLEINNIKRALNKRIKKANNSKDGTVKPLTMLSGIDFATNTILNPHHTPAMFDWNEVALKMITLEAAKRGATRIALPSGEFLNTYQMGTHDEESKLGREIYYDKVLTSDMNGILKKIDKNAKLEKSNLNSMSETVTTVPDRDAFIQKVIELVGLEVDYAPTPIKNRTQYIENSVRDMLQFVDRDSKGVKVAERYLIEALRFVHAENPKLFPNLNAEIAKVKDLIKEVTIVKPGPAVYSYDFTPENITKLRDDGLVMYQDNKASVGFLNDSRAIIKALTNPDFSSIVHELAHIARRQFLDSKDVAGIERMFGVQHGIWTTKAEESFARTFEAFFRGKIGYDTIKDPRTVEIFKTIQEFMREVYKQADDIKGAKPINTEFEGAVRRMFVDESTQLKYSEDQVSLLEDQLNHALKTDPRGDPKIQARNAELRKDLKEARDQLQDMINREFNPRTGTLAQERANKYAYVNELANKSREQRRSFSDSHFIRWARGLYDISNIMHKTDAANIFMQGLDDMVADYSAQAVPYQDALVDVLFDQLSYTQRKVLGVNDNKTGLPSIVRMFDQKAVTSADKLAPPDWAKNTMRMFTAIHDLITHHMETAQGYRRLPSGDTVPFRESMERTVPHILTSEGYAKIQDPGSKEYQAWINKILERNPGITREDLEKWSKREIGFKADDGFKYGEAITRRQGFVEGSRKIKYVPFTVDVDGKSFSFFHTDPYEIGSRWIESGLRRIATIKMLGSGMLEDVGETQSYMNNILGLIGKKLKPLNKVEMVQQLVDHRILDKTSLNKKTVAELIKYSDSVDLETRVTHAEVLAQFNKLSHKDFTDHVYSLDANANAKLKNQAIAAIIKVGRKIGGVDTDLTIVKGKTSTGKIKREIDPDNLGRVMYELKDRMNEKIMDDVYDKLREGHYRQGGNPADMDRVWHVFQDRPLAVPGATGTGRTIQLASTIVESSMTSLNVLSNAFQFLVAVNESTEGRLRNIPRALVDTVKSFYQLADDYDLVRKEGFNAGAMKPTLQRYTTDSNYWMTRASQFIRGTTGTIFGSARMSEFLNVFSLRMAQHMAERWQTKFDPRKSGAQARRLRLKEAEIAEIAAGKLEPGSLTYNKILQNFIKITQGNTEAKHRKGYIENNPWLKMAFSFSSYMNLQNRRAEATMTELHKSYKDFKSLKNLASADKLLAATGAVIVGLGFAVSGGELNRLLKDSVHRRPPERDDEEWWQRMKNDLMEYQAIGHAARFFEIGDHPQSTQNALLAQSPLASTVSQFLTAAYGGGKYSKYPFYTRLGKSYLDILPAYKLSNKYLEYYVHPRREVFDNLRKDVQRWSQRQSWYEPNANQYAVDPLTYEIFEHVARGDLKQAQKSIGAYMKIAPKMYIADGRDPEEIVQNLRQSLMSRRPINLNERRLPGFIQSLPKHKRRVYLQANARYVGMVNALVPSQN